MSYDFETDGVEMMQIHQFQLASFQLYQSQNRKTHEPYCLLRNHTIQCQNLLYLRGNHITWFTPRYDYQSRWKITGAWLVIVLSWFWKGSRIFTEMVMSNVISYQRTYLSFRATLTESLVNWSSLVSVWLIKESNGPNPLDGSLFPRNSEYLAPDLVGHVECSRRWLIYGR